ncbi:benzoate 4-monooxygenase cytochrome P450 [Mytilinidion resinicola]|uniref:Benzoate 4-monooxygenase cytochrome P450 n=1 Tax=Mytilinidion resinicola TaxID=574789 RepID=A0A6A6Z8H1_9PEZI|nr:benzoate 4-monooxygenase cytochrome P450 [Mytilinidion resinicola]KAF2817316.1 benzoate 4-monooxygenase cytochrome P450 [Mytilinidion resinicola]
MSAWLTGTAWSGNPAVLLAGAFVLLFLLQWVYKVVYNLYLAPLRNFPGPKLWAVSRLPYALSVTRGHHHLDILELHKRYGSVVRISPHELAFNSAQAFRDIYGFRPGHQSFRKDRTHYVYPPNGVDHLVSAVDDGVHARHRRLLANVFSERELRAQEPLIRGYVDLLISKLQLQIQEGKGASVDIRSWFNYTTFDVTGDLMFGESFGCLRDSQLHPWIALIFASMKALAFLGAVNQYPAFSAVLQKMIPASIIQKGVDHFNLSARKVDRRLEMGAERPDFVSAILKNGLSEKEGQYAEAETIMTRAEIHSNAFILIVAGSETSATLLSGAIYYLCKNPSTMEKVLEEIRNAFTADNDITFSKATTLSYLNAVIEESLRIYPPFVTSLARLAPAGGDTVDGHFIPENTTVACHHYASYHSPSNFVSPDDFVPERWLDTDSRFAEDKKDTVQAFSLGPRNCIGKNLAYAEIRLILCKVLFNFDIALCPESEHWKDQEVYFLWDKPPLVVSLTERAVTV